MRVRRLTAYDLSSLCHGATKNLGIQSGTVDSVCCKFADARDAVFPKTPRLRSVEKNLDFVLSCESIATGVMMRTARWTSQLCSGCGSIPGSSSKGMGALGIRHRVCSECGGAHDRDINAALNTLRVGRNVGLRQ